MVCVPGGLAVSYPGANVHGGSGNIMGGGVSKTGDFVIGHSGMVEFSQADLAGQSDWFIEVEFAKGEARLQTSFGHGSPFVFCNYAGGKPEIRFRGKPKVWAGSERDAVLGITAGGHHYGLFGASGSTWSGLDGTTFTNETEKAYLYNTERTAVEEYWFDVSGTNYPEDFPEVALGMVWGGKGAFATWFSGDVDCIHGINWLPFTPASIYMGRFPDYVKTNHDRIVAKRKGCLVGTGQLTGQGI